MQPFNYDYSQTLTYKVFMARKPDQVLITIEQAFDVIRQIHRMSAGMPQVVYLVGWQYDGHDSKYPSWAAGNDRLKRAGDRDMIQSIRWLIGAAKEYSAAVSLHINMDDAYPNSPLWDEYIARDLIVRKPDGTLLEAGVWDGEMSYHVCKPREWATGLGQRRIDELLNLIPELRTSGTIHIDAFRPQDEMSYAGVTYDHELQTVRDILTYWRKNNIDVTTEFLASHELVGWHPMVYHLNACEQTRLQYPPNLLCGGGPAWNMRWKTLRDKPQWIGSFTAPEAGCRYEEAWGVSVDSDVRSSTDMQPFAEMFFTRTPIWHFLNRHRAESFTQTRQTYTVRFADDVISEVRTADRHHTVRHGDRLLVDGGSYFLPAEWHDGAWIAYSRSGGRSTWRKPTGWGAEAKVRRLWPASDAEPIALRTSGDQITIDLAAGEAVLVQAA